MQSEFRKILYIYLDIIPLFKNQYKKNPFLSDNWNKIIKKKLPNWEAKNTNDEKTLFRRDFKYRLINELPIMIQINLQKKDEIIKSKIKVEKISNLNA